MLESPHNIVQLIVEVIDLKEHSVKHHYLPRHYLEGFTDDKGGFLFMTSRQTKYFKLALVLVFLKKILIR